MNELNDNILQTIICPSCLHYMAPPIYECTKGHSVCGQCKSTRCPVCHSNVTNMRHQILEQICEKLFYPCSNRELGCNESLRIGDMEEHLTSCSFRSYTCKLDEHCSWQGRWTEIGGHAIDRHDLRVVYGNETVQMWRPKKAATEIVLMMAFRELFYVHRILKNNIMYWTVQYIGKSEDVILYCFELHLFTDQFDNRSIKFSEICHDDIKDIDDIIDCGLCIAVPIAILETYKDSNEVVFHRITIKKL